MFLANILNQFVVMDPTDVSSTTLDDPSTLLETSNSIENFTDNDDAALLQLAEEYATNNETVLPPSSNSFKISEIEMQIRDIKDKLNFLYELSTPQTITIHNFHHLKNGTAVTTVKDKLNCLFFEASIPINWKISLVWTEQTLPKTNKNIVDTVTITLLNYHVKMKTLDLLKKYFAKTYDNTIFV